MRANLDLHAHLYRIPDGREWRSASRTRLRHFGLVEAADQKPSSLPLGIRQRLQLAAACLHRPEVLILDEPTSGVDPAARDMFWSLLRELSRARRGHDLRLDTLHERGRALRSHIADACRPGPRHRHAGGAAPGKGRGEPRRRLRRLSRGGRWPAVTAAPQAPATRVAAPSRRRSRRSCARRRPARLDCGGSGLSPTARCASSCAIACASHLRSLARSFCCSPSATASPSMSRTCRSRCSTATRAPTAGS